MMQSAVSFVNCCWTIPRVSGFHTKLQLRLRQQREVSTVVAMATPTLQPEWTSFPYLSSSGKRLLQDVVNFISSELSDSLNPSRTPEDVRRFKSSKGNGEGSVTICTGTQESPIDFVLGSWLYCNTPVGPFNIATVVGMMNQKTDSPHLLLEFIQSGENKAILVLDRLPRKDPVLDSEYLKHFYEDTALESIRQELQKSPYVKHYELSALYLRCLTSPTAFLYKFEVNPDSEEPSLDHVIDEAVSPAAKKVIQVWVDGTRTLGKKMSEVELEVLSKRDKMIKSKAIEYDLSVNLPNLFGQEVADRVVEAFRNGQ